MVEAKPVVLCGRSPQIASSVKKGLEPEYEGVLLSILSSPRSSNLASVIHIILSPAAGVSDIPAILQGQSPSSTEENIGTQNYSNLPIAVVTGGGYDDRLFKEMYDAAKGKGKAVHWLRPDLSVQTPPLGPDYGKHMVGRVKACLERLEGEGKLGEEKGEGEVVMF